MLIASEEKAAKLIEDPNIADNQKIHILLIKSTNLSDTNALPLYKESAIVSNYTEAKLFLTDVALSALPDLIVVDIPLNFKEIISFKAWVSRNFVPPIPMIFNEALISNAEATELHNLQLIDDVIAIDYTSTTLLDKTKFLKKLFVQRTRESVHKNKASRTHNTYDVGLVKRLFDIIVSLTALTLLLPIFLIIILFIKLETKGPAIYKSKRAGKGFKIFDFYKFRTMQQDADSKVEELYQLNSYADSSSAETSPSFFKIINDPRITKVGAFLRNTSLDELPQLLNVLKGDMSIVGNRPLPLYEATTLTTDELAERFMAPAGITGLWQVKKRGKKEMSTKERVELDINYARNNTLARDFWILAKTPSALIQKENV